MTPHTAAERAALDEALKTFAQFGEGFPAYALEITNRVNTGKLKDWEAVAVAVNAFVLTDWLLTLPTRAAWDLLESEALLGWYADDCVDWEEYDADGEFMSTPSVGAYDPDDEEQMREDIADAVDHIQREGWLVVG